jgi:hypothetical protein
MSDGMDCNCGAYGEHECGCGVDWTTQEVYDLREEVKQLREAKESFILMDFTAACTKVSRFEVIDHTSTGTGRDFVKYGVTVALGYQDDGKTLKVFLRDKE